MCRKHDTMKRHTRVHVCFRLDEAYVTRIERIAEVQRCSPRSVVEQMLEGYLPEIEKRFGIEPPDETPSKQQ